MSFNHLLDEDNQIEPSERLSKYFTEKVKLYSQAANHGNAEMQCALGDCYFYGHGIVKDDVYAVMWYRKAAEQDFAEAQYKLGMCYAKGFGVEKDTILANHWWGKAVDHGHPKAQLSLALSCFEDENIISNILVFYLCNKAAKQGIAEAQFLLAKCYTDKIGRLWKNKSKAAQWLRKAAEQGLKEAQYNLGECYQNGDGVTKSYTEAVKWYRKAAEQGLKEAQNKLRELGET